MGLVFGLDAQEVHSFFFSFSRMPVEISSISSREKSWSSMRIWEGLQVRQAILKACWTRGAFLLSQLTQLGSSWRVGIWLFSPILEDLRAQRAVPCLSISSWMTMWLITELKLRMSFTWSRKCTTADSVWFCLALSSPRESCTCFDQSSNLASFSKICFLRSSYLVSYSSDLRSNCSCSSFIHVLVGLISSSMIFLISLPMAPIFSATTLAISSSGKVKLTDCFLPTSSSSCSLGSSILNSQTLAPYLTESLTARLMMYFLLRLTILRMLLVKVDIISSRVMRSFMRMWWCRRAKRCSSQRQSLRRCLPSTKLLSVQLMCIWMQSGWYCYRKVVRKRRSLSTSFTFPRNFSESLESRYLSSTRAVRLMVFSYSLMIFSLWLLASSSSFLMSLALCLVSSSSSLRRLSKEIILLSILVVAALVIFLNWLISSVCASCFFVISYNSLSNPYLCCRNSYARCRISRSSLPSSSFSCRIFSSQIWMTASIFLILPSLSSCAWLVWVAMSAIFWSCSSIQVGLVEFYLYSRKS